MIAILANIHDAEAPYIESFVNHHSQIGIQEFIFASSERCHHQRAKRILNSLDIPMVVVPSQIPMRRARDWCHRYINIKSAFVAAIDIDEFLIPEHLDFCFSTDCDHASFPWLCNVNVAPNGLTFSQTPGAVIARGKSIFKIRKTARIDDHRAIMEIGADVRPMSDTMHLPIQHFYARSCGDLILKDIYTRNTSPEYAPHLFSDYSFAQCFFSRLHPAKLTGRLAACALISSLQEAERNKSTKLLTINHLEDEKHLRSILGENKIIEEHITNLSNNIKDIAAQVTPWQQGFLANSLADIKYFTENATASKYGWFLDRFAIPNEGVNIRQLAVELFRQNYQRAQSPKQCEKKSSAGSCREELIQYSALKNTTKAPWHQTREWNKCFGIGFNKTGTTSLDEAMRSLGLRSRQSEVEFTTTSQMIKGDYSPFIHAMKDLDFHQDLPVSQGWHFAALDALFPNSRFILTVRDPVSWAESFVSYYSLELLSITYKREPRQQPYLATGYTQAWLSHFLLASDISNGNENPAYASISIDEARETIQLPEFKKRLTRIYETRNSAIRSYFANRPEDFIEINVSATDCYGRLCRFLGAPVIEAPMPHLNRRSTGPVNPIQQTR
ncbi:MAG: sulfotransferase [Rhodoluna sp.]